MNSDLNYHLGPVYYFPKTGYLLVFTQQPQRTPARE